MIRLHHIADTSRIVITKDDDPANAITLADLGELLRLRARINTYLDTQQPDAIIEPAEDLARAAEYIPTADALRLAEEEGRPVPATTLRSAIDAGSIPGSHKRGGRWYVPRSAFLEWLENR